MPTLENWAFRTTCLVHYHDFLPLGKLWLRDREQKNQLLHSLNLVDHTNLFCPYHFIIHSPMQVLHSCLNHNVQLRRLLFMTRNSRAFVNIVLTRTLAPLTPCSQALVTQDTLPNHGEIIEQREIHVTIQFVGRVALQHGLPGYIGRAHRHLLLLGRVFCDSSVALTT